MKTHTESNADTDLRVTRHTPYEALPQLLTVEEFAEDGRIGRTLAFEIARSVGIRFGRRLLVPKTTLKS